MEPAERLKDLAKKSEVNVVKSISAVKYYRSGPEMMRMAKIYLNEGKHEEAYCLFLKYISLFLTKIREHPEFAMVPDKDKATTMENIKTVLPKAEELKVIISEKYKEQYKNWLIEEKKREERRVLEEQHEPQKLPPPYEIPRPSAPPPYFRQDGLREIYIPSSLISKFMQLAMANTVNNIETCAFLTGTLQADRLTITVLLVPEQRGTSDDCTAENDVATFDVIDSRGLITLGWIHTHPSQDAFLSSVDLHSQFGYQAMLPEAVAIVCAPKHSNQIFRLSEMGLDVIRKCSVSGFHPHPGPTLFEVASHAKVLDIPLEIIDLRKKWS